jgi:tol-pal system protein YbgF
MEDFMRRVILPALVAMPFAFHAHAASDHAPKRADVQALAFNRIPQADLPGMPSIRSDAPVLLAQAGDPRVTQLEEQIRQLSGTIEELNFQILQMQEQLRKMQEDNEFRFQQLEGGGAGTPPRRSDAGQQQPPAQGPNRQQAAGAQAGPAQPGGAQPDNSRTFGTITFDAKGNAVGGGVGPAADGSNASKPVGQDNTTVAALPSSDDPEELYQNSYQFILSGDYKTAETGFRDLIDRFPGNKHEADAHFWLGEAVLGQDRFRDAAQIFLAASRDYPKSKKAPDMLLKLGISLAAMKQKDVACATFTEVGMRYPGVSAALKDRVKQEQTRAGC